MQTSMGVYIESILSTDEVLSNLGTFTFVALHLFYVGGRNFQAISELLRLIERLEELQTNVQVIITSPRLSMSLLYYVPR